MAALRRHLNSWLHFRLPTKGKIELSSKEMFEFAQLQGNFSQWLWSNILDFSNATPVSLPSPPSGEPSSWLTDAHLLLASSHGGEEEGDEGCSLVASCKDPTLGPQPHDSSITNYIPKAPPPKTIPLQVRLQLTNGGGRALIQSIIPWLWKDISILKAPHPILFFLGKRESLWFWTADK